VLDKSGKYALNDLSLTVLDTLDSRSLEDSGTGESYDPNAPVEEDAENVFSNPAVDAEGTSFMLVGAILFLFPLFATNLLTCSPLPFIVVGWPNTVRDVWALAGAFGDGGGVVRIIESAFVVVCAAAASGNESCE
jgi:hypothetical protein